MPRLLQRNLRCWLMLSWLLIPFTIAAQVITGTITDENGKPMNGVNVSEKGKAGGVAAKTDGSYSITVSTSGATLVFSFVGYAAKEIPVNGLQVINVKLLPDDNRQMDQVVVIGYGTSRRKDLTGSVASVKGNELRQVPSANAIKSMQGMVAGVDIASANNTPDANPVIRIRGNRSINAGNDPLIVVDGLPFGGSLNDLSTGDIKSIEVLKDASATAIYGSRGANGVILITTNRGIAGRVQVTYNGYYGLQSVLNAPELMNGAEFAAFRREAERNAGRYNAATPTPELDAAMFYFRDAEVEASVLNAYNENGNYEPAKVRSFDWIDAVTRQGSQQEHQVTVSAGSTKSMTSLSLGYFDNVGVVKGFDFKRYNFRLTYDNQLSERVKIGGTLAFSSSVNLSTDNLYEIAGLVNPLAPIRDSSGGLIQEPASDPLSFNPLIRLEGVSTRVTTNRFFGNLFGELGLLPGLKYRLNFAPDYRFSRTGGFRNSRANQGSPSSAIYNTNQLFHYVLDNMLIYDKSITTNHKINLTVLQSIERDRLESQGTSVRDLPYDQQLFYNLGTANEVASVSSGLTEWSLSSFMARLNYGYKGRYLLTFTGRYDGSSRLASGNKWDFFPSAAFAWNVSDERFLATSRLVSDLKFRLSYGVTGNTAIAPYQTQGGLFRTLYATDDIPAYGYQPNLITNPSLRWEKTRQANLGLDYGFFNNRLTGSFDWYRQNTDDLLLSRQLPTASGFSSIIENIGSTQNQGIEFSLRAAVIERPGNGLRLTTQLTFTRNREEILSLYAGKVDDVGNRWFIGHPVNTYYDYKKTGIFQSKTADEALIQQYNSNGGTFAVGEIKIQDTNGDGRINAEDRVILGSAVPDWYGSLNTTLAYKGFDVSCFVFARQGQMVFNTQEVAYEGRNNWLKVDYWTASNPTQAYPKPVSGRRVPLYGQTLSYQDASFIRIRNITFGYTFPDRMKQRVKASNIRIYAAALNPFLFTRFVGMDPEGSVGLTTPSVKTFMVGINLSF